MTIAFSNMRGLRKWPSFFRDRRGSSAVEFAIVAMPFFLLLMGVTQVGMFYMAQSALDTGVIKTAELLQNSFKTGSSPTLLSGAALKSNVATAGGGMIANDANLAVEIRQVGALTAAAVPISDGTTDYGAKNTTLVIRAQATVATLAPGLGGLNIVRSSSMVRRQGT